MTQIALAPAGWLARLPGPDGARSVLAHEGGGLTVKLYAPRGFDPQQPHVRDEIYVVVSGSGTFVHGSSRDTFGPGDFLFASAGLAHRFEEFGDDLAVWVIFYGPDGGEQPASVSARVAPGTPFDHGSLTVGGAAGDVVVRANGELVIAPEARTEDDLWVMAFA
ncbi:MAG TPA: cupin domain-containing protein [Thermoanaerobaculia bacterium]|nr:cupin domain-containing protein [Thermoanaerobaculia bacterium]